jgi:hypothetical protein
MIIYIKATNNVDDKILSKLMNTLIVEGYKVEKYLSMSHKIVMARKFEKELGGTK